MAGLVHLRVLDGIAIIVMDAPPVNALSAKLRVELWEIFQRVGSNDKIKAVVFSASGTTFSAGEDISEFDEEFAHPNLSQICTLIEDMPIPVVVAAQGQAIGGGAELMLAGHYRVVGPNARISLPATTLGLIPSAGGTQRLPRLIGVDLTLQVLLSNSSIEPEVGRKIGLIDAIVDGDLKSGAISFANDILEQGKGPRPTRADRTHFSDGGAFRKRISETRTRVRMNPEHAPNRVVDCVEAAALLPFEAGLAFEEDAFLRSVAHPQSVAFRHVFRAERRIDRSLIEREGAKFVLATPMGATVVQRLKNAMERAAQHIVEVGASREDVDAALVGYGFHRGPFGGQQAGADDRQISRRIVAALLAEGGVCFEQNLVKRPADIDVLAVHGIGFPRRIGGPMRAAQTDGLLGFRNDMRSWAEHSDLWAVPDVLNDAVKHAAGFNAVSGL